MSKTGTDIRPFSYSKKEGLIAAIFLPPFAFLLNYVMFGHNYFSSLKYFLLATVLTFAIILLTYVSCGMIASVLNNRYPKYSQTFKRISIGLCVYVAIMSAAISIIFWGYDYIGFLGYQLNPNQYAWCLIIGIFCNILATSLNEGAAFYDKWRQTVDEAENLKKENLQSQLEGLKDQVNPHFLFNSLNSL